MQEVQWLQAGASGGTPASARQHATEVIPRDAPPEIWRSLSARPTRVKVRSKRRANGGDLRFSAGDVAPLTTTSSLTGHGVRIYT